MVGSVWLQGFFTTLALIVAIGAQNAYVLRQGLKKQHVTAVVSVCMLGDIVMITLGIAGVGAAIAEWPALMNVFRFGGAAFLTYYGWLAFLRARAGGGSLAASSDVEMTLGRAVTLTAAFTFLNPHVYLDTLVLLGGIAATQPADLRFWFGIGACSASFLWFTSLGYGSRFLIPFFRSERSWRILDGLIAGVMWLLAAGLLFGAV